MSIRNTIKKTGDLLLCMSALALTFNLAVSYARIHSNPEKKRHFDKVPLFVHGSDTSKAEMLGDNLPYKSNLPIETGIMGALLAEAASLLKKKKEARG